MPAVTAAGTGGSVVGIGVGDGVGLGIGVGVGFGPDSAVEWIGF